MKVRIEIETKTFVRFWLVVVGFLAAIVSLYSARQALIVLGVAFFLALALNGPVSALANILPGKSRVGGTAIAYVLVLFFLGLFAFLVVPPVVEQTAKVAQTIPTIVDQVQTQWRGLSVMAEHYGMQEQLNQTLESIKTSSSEWAANLAANAGNSLVSSVGSILNFMVAAFLVIVLTFLMLIEAPRWSHKIWSIYSDEDKMKHHKELASRMYDAVTGFIMGQLAVSGIGAFFTGMTVFILSMLFNVPTNLALPAAAIAFTLSLIPMFGATIAGILIGILLAFNDVTAAIIFVIYFVLYQQIENNFISPTIQSRTVELSALAILASVTIGIYLFGIAGGIISIPIAGSINVLLEDYLAHKKKKRKERSIPLQHLVDKLKHES